MIQEMVVYEGITPTKLSISPFVLLVRHVIVIFGEVESISIMNTYIGSTSDISIIDSRGKYTFSKKNKRSLFLSVKTTFLHWER